MEHSSGGRREPLVLLSDDGSGGTEQAVQQGRSLPFLGTRAALAVSSAARKQRIQRRRLAEGGSRNLRKTAQQTETRPPRTRQPSRKALLESVPSCHDSLCNHHSVPLSGNRAARSPFSTPSSFILANRWAYLKSARNGCCEHCGHQASRDKATSWGRAFAAGTRHRGSGRPLHAVFHRAELAGCLAPQCER